jgi:hypothetical protein
VQVTILADRGFFDIAGLQALTQDWGFDYVVRFRGNIPVTAQHGESRPAQDWVAERGRARTLRQIPHPSPVSPGLLVQ